MPWNGSPAHREALRLAVCELFSTRRISQVSLAARVADYNIKQLLYPDLKDVGIDRSTLSRWADYTAEEFENISPRRCKLVYNFLESNDDLATKHIDGRYAQIDPSARSLSIFNMLRSLGLSASGDEYGRLKSLEGVYSIYRRAWLHSERHDLATRSQLKIYAEDGLLYGTEMQDYIDPYKHTPVSEEDFGVVFSYGSNLFFIAVGDSVSALKFYVFHDFFPHPTGRNRVYQLEGNMIGAAGKGPHPGYKVVCRREDREVKTATLAYDDVPDDIRLKIGLRESP